MSIGSGKHFVARTGTHITCFYWYKSTNTDEAGAAACPIRLHLWLRQYLNLLLI